MEMAVESMEMAPREIPRRQGAEIQTSVPRNWSSMVAALQKKVVDRDWTI
jgi:hypothetical protein